MELFPKDRVAGIFQGFSQGGLEFHADLILPYARLASRTSHGSPVHGQFLLVQLESSEEAVLGRITSVLSQGRLASGAGEDYGIRAVLEDRSVDDELRHQYLKYRIDIRVLGLLRVLRGGSGKPQVVFAPSHRRLPHVGSKVAFLSDELLREIAGHNDKGAELGYLAFGEFIYGQGHPHFRTMEWMQPLTPSVVPRFDVKDLVSRRSFVFARAGFGKSNVVKLLFSSLYRDGTPHVEKRAGRQVPVGTIVFDPDGEYFWPDDKGRPGICDVDGSEKWTVVFTNRAAPSPFYGSFVAGGIKLDIRRLRPADVISIALSPERQDQQNVRKLRSLGQRDWSRLVDEIYKNKNAADLTIVADVLDLEQGRQDAELYAARANMTAVVQMLHDPSSQLMDMLLEALREGKLCVVDVSQMRGAPALALSGLILRRIFDHNQDEFTKAKPSTIPTVAVVEEAQTVLGSRGGGGEGPYVEWVKEGRKFDLGAVLITQQPGSIPDEILSQGDNWFVFHLLSAGDLHAVQKANAHFSEDLLASLLNEPIAGNGVFWTSAKTDRSYPLPLRPLSFETLHSRRDPNYDQASVSSFAAGLRDKHHAALAKARESLRNEGEERDQALATTQPLDVDPLSSAEDFALTPEPAVDATEIHVQAAIRALSRDTEFQQKWVRRGAFPWMAIVQALVRNLPTVLADRDSLAYEHSHRAIRELFGKEGPEWYTERREKKNDPQSTTVWVVLSAGASNGSKR
jgi:DNA helicase HerA-like ATPase